MGGGLKIEWCRRHLLRILILGLVLTAAAVMKACHDDQGMIREHQQMLEDEEA